MTFDRRLDALERLASPPRCLVVHQPLDLEGDALDDWLRPTRERCEREGMTLILVVREQPEPVR
jgi:hypothetical protein